MLNAKQLPEAIRLAFSLDITSLILGPPGCGKTSIVEQIAEEDNLKLLVLSLSQAEPGDLLGYARVNEQTNKFDYVPFSGLPLETDPLPEGKDGWIFFIDDALNGLPAVQVACYRLIQERRVGNHKIHPKCRIVAASNRDEDGCYIYSMSKAFVSKVMILNFLPETEAWLDYGSSKGFDYRILSYISAYPENLNKEVPDSADISYPCGRTWERTSMLIKDKPDISGIIIRNCIEGLIGATAASHFLAFTKYFNRLPEYEDIIKEPLNTPLVDRDDVGMQWACIGMLLNNLDPKDNYAELVPILEYLNRGPQEYLLALLRQLVLTHPRAIHTSVVKPYITKLAKLLKG